MYVYIYNMYIYIYIYIHIKKIKKYKAMRGLKNKKLILFSKEKNQSDQSVLIWNE